MQDPLAIKHKIKYISHFTIQLMKLKIKSLAKYSHNDTN